MDTPSRVFRIVALLWVPIASYIGLSAEEHYPKAIYRTQEDLRLEKVMEQREADWRNGAVVYQVIVDRFAPSQNLEAKMEHYAPPRALREWHEQPTSGKPAEGTDYWTHELDFWGGDLDSLTGKLDYLEDLGVEVIYLNPIQLATTNHKYDAIDYKKVSPEYGTREDVGELAKGLHERGMKLVLDGVFNHMGTSSPYFQEALADPESPYREWFFIGDGYKRGYRSWIDSKSLPELRLENKAVRDYLFLAPDSVIRGYLAEGVDGWRLDVAFDVGPTYLAELTEAAHKEKPGSLVVGEIWSYPDGWFQGVDAVMNFPARKIIQSLLDGKVSGPSAGDMFEKMVEDSGIENMLKSWTLIDNHDTKRLKNMLPEPWQQELAQVLQFTLPGAPNLYYGVELGMEGGSDPQNRGPMQWELVTDDNPDLIRIKKLIQLRKDHRALRIGNYRTIVAGKLLAFERYTDKALETVLVVANTSDESVSESVLIRNWKVQNGVPAIDVMTGERFSEIRSSVMEVTLEPKSIRVLRVSDFDNEWSPFERLF
jgi:cyclomaltodextrinase